MNNQFKEVSRKLILIVSITVFIISLINFYKGVKEYYNNDKLYRGISNLNPFENNDLNIAYDELKELNSDYTAWLYIPNTNISYPIVKGTDNSFYLNHNFLKEESKAGSIFIDSNVNEFEDKNTIIYGHYMKDGSMFADLHKIYSNPSSTNKIYIATKNKILKYEIFSIFKDSANISNYQTFWSADEDYINYLNNLASKSNNNYNTSLNKNSSIITLSTCDFNYSNGRLLIVAVLFE
ncbi:class B sortase [Clostridium nigeriense]|uniref:class B sortase n=1 Tax=Clostridium nigeriense TaxID=1805470 RepID=UPI003D325489